MVLADAMVFANAMVFDDANDIANEACNEGRKF